MKFGPPIVTNGLILYLDAANRKSYRGTGNSWLDLSGNNRNGTLNNFGATPFNNINGGAITFDGTDDYVSGTLPSTSTWTINLWFYSTDITSKLVFYIFSGTLDVASGIGFGGTYVTETQNRWWWGDNFAYSNANMAITTNTWYNLTVTDNGSSNFNFYTNGVLSYGPVFISSRTLDTYNIGRRASSDAWYANGKMATTSVYNRVLSAAEVLQNYNATKTRFGL